MYMLTLQSISMHCLNVLHCQCSLGIYSPYINQKDPRLHMVHMFICLIYNLPISNQLVSPLYSMVNVMFSHVWIFSLLVDIPTRLDSNVTSRNFYWLYCTFLYVLTWDMYPSISWIAHVLPQWQSYIHCIWY